MTVSRLDIDGPLVIDLDLIEDERGFFARAFCRQELLQHAVDFTPVQCNISYNRKAGTVRGLHFQAHPLEEGKIVRCVHGSIWDVAIDIRPGSPTRCQHVELELSSDNRRALFVPAGFAHGFQTQSDDAQVFYMMNNLYSGEHARGLRWNDPRIKIEWPQTVTCISQKDLSYPDFETCISGVSGATQ